MNAKRLLKHYEKIAEAPDAIARLRRFVLDLAVRGKLVPQDPKDEPASELLKRIAEEKARLIGAGEIKARNVPSRDRADPIEFVCPNGWVLTELGVVSLKITDGAHKTPTYVESGVPFISVKDFSAGKLDMSATRFIPEHEHRTLYQRCDPRRGDILIGRIGTLGKAVLVDTDVEFSLFVSVGLIRFDHNYIHPEFFRLLLNSPFVEAEFDRIKIGGGTHTNKLNLGDLHTVALPLPPLAEQVRIVAKVEELMALCKNLEAVRKERETTRDRVTAASLARLNSPDPESFADDARFVLGNLPALTNRPDQIKLLRQTILNLAVRGKLVPQDQKDEPASDIKLQARGRGRGQVQEIIDEPYKLPLGWSWRAVDTVADQVTDGEHATPPRISDPQIPLVTAKNVRDGYMDYDQTDWVSVDTAQKAWRRCRPEVGDLLLVCVGATTGRLTVLRERQDMVLVRSVALIRPNADASAEYLECAFRSPVVQRQIWSSVKAAAQPCLYINRIQSLLIPLPPLPEQMRVVAKVNELMALCEQLEASLTAADASCTKLLEALLAEALTDKASFQVEAA